MQVALHSKDLSAETMPFIADVLHTLHQRQATLFISPSMQASLQARQDQLPPIQPLTAIRDFSHINLMISLGGDRTLLEAVQYIGASETPILGINLGRMGFLATVAPEDALAALAHFYQGKYTLDRRTLLQSSAQKNAPPTTNFVLNEVALLKQESASMIAVHATINTAWSTTYWADGQIIATPTGSTGYSLSCNGPIVLPNARNLIITPVSPHNLSVRPLIVPDSTVISLKVTSRNQKFLITHDGHSRTVNTATTLTIKKASFQAYLVNVNQHNSFDILRQKLHWGLDVRN